jgi:hypothetical protein
MKLSVLEIRNYHVKNGVRDQFITEFEKLTIVPQEESGMFILGQFQLIGQPERFVWIRGFENMETRLEALNNFYGGPVWKEIAPELTPMMVDVSDVHLLRPLAEIDPKKGYSAQDIASDFHSESLSLETGLVTVEYFRTKDNCKASFLEVLEEDTIRLQAQNNHPALGLYVSELAENDFPRLPVIQDENLFVRVSAHATENEFQKTVGIGRQADPNSNVEPAARAMLSEDVKILMLKPTPKSPLQYRES